MQCSREHKHYINERMQMILKNDIHSKIIRVVRVIDKPSFINSEHSSDTLAYFRDWANKFNECNTTFNFSILKHLLNSTPREIFDIDIQKTIVETCLTLPESPNAVFCTQMDNALTDFIKYYLNWFQVSSEAKKYTYESMIMSFGLFTRIMTKLMLWSASQKKFTFLVFQSTNFINMFLLKANYFKELAHHISNPTIRGQFVTLLTNVNKISKAWVYIWLNKTSNYTIQFGAKGGVYVMLSSKRKKYF